MTDTVYTAQVHEGFADQFQEWRPITDLADEIKIVTHTDGTCELHFRTTPKQNVVHLSTNGNGAGEPR